MEKGQENVMEIVKLESEFGKKLIAKFGEMVARELIQFLRTEGLPIEFPAKIVDGITLSGIPEIRIDFLNGDGSVVRAGNQDNVTMAHRFLVYVDGKPQLTVKSVKIPELDYGKVEPLTVQMTYYCMDEGMIKKLQDDSEKNKLDT
jgi:hypothetical protein